MDPLRCFAEPAPPPVRPQGVRLSESARFVRDAAQCSPNRAAGPEGADPFAVLGDFPRFAGRSDLLVAAIAAETGTE